MPLLDCDREVLYTTTISESLNARFRQAVRRRGHLPTKRAATKVLHLIVGQRRKSGSITSRVYG